MMLVRREVEVSNELTLLIMRGMTCLAGSRSTSANSAVTSESQKVRGSDDDDDDDDNDEDESTSVRLDNGADTSKKNAVERKEVSSAAYLGNGDDDDDDGDDADGDDEDDGGDGEE